MKFRIAALACHLAVTAVLLLIPVWLVVYTWYPDFFLVIDGGLTGLQMLAAVQIIVGPLLTLVVFRPGKKGLRQDLILIGILQLICLVGGTWILYEQRPLFFVYYDGFFYSTSAGTYERFGLEVPDYTRITDETPARVISMPPSHPLEEAGFRKILYDDEIPLWAYGPTYKPLAPNMDRVMTAGIPQALLREWGTGDRLPGWLDRHGGGYADYVFIPVHARFQDAVVAIDKSDRTFAGTMPITLPLPKR